MAEDRALAKIELERVPYSLLDCVETNQSVAIERLDSAAANFGRKQPLHK